MTRWTDDRIDSELRDLLEWQADETADAPSADQMALRIRTRSAGAIGSRWRLSPTTVVASLVVLLVLAFAATMTIGAWRPIFDGRAPEPLAVILTTSPTPTASTQDEPVVSPSPSGPVPSAVPSPSSSAMPSGTPGSSATASPSEPAATPSPEPAPTPTPDPVTPPPTPTPTPVLDPTVRLLIDGEAGEFGRVITSGRSVDVELTLVTRDLERSACELTHRTDPDAPGKIRRPCRSPPRSARLSR